MTTVPQDLDTARIHRIREHPAAQRRELSAVRAPLTPKQGNAPSPYGGWRARGVAAHMSTGFRRSTARTLLGPARSGGRIHRTADPGRPPGRRRDERA
ncbi:maleylpyruvate isomerase N-terminal domain-containing protein [Kitasatospora sp. NPDC018619]|uniref:maleylpyruvate isomerase N-terminal domain-containing protein n=1 Tax=unclassified Kitasatospora TaxID=2633591 RepID=UPI00379F3738